ncbi:hypothetical protein [Virgibacillus sp. Bac330]|uniref:hypothetical protein n=1 Tax=Virgibacillus sp. Bac330 TaxID=2419841 RepID=UPI0013CF2797|nr:hypothetical protein [Virgibacillus sp. Bac330]
MYLFRKLWDKIGLGRLLCKLMDDAEVASRYDEAIFAMVLNRLMDPKSKHHIFRNWVKTVQANQNLNVTYINTQTAVD